MEVAERPATSDTGAVGLRSRLESRARFGSYWIVLPGLAWLLIFYIIPTLIMVRFSLLSSMPNRGLPVTYTFQHYVDAVSSSVYPKVFLKSAQFATMTTVALLLICFPVAYFLAKKTQHQKVLLILIMIPFWTSQVLRAFAWIILLSRTGMVNELLQSLNLTSEPIQLIYNWRAVTAALIYSYIPYMILPLYATLGKISDDLLEASADLGANKIQTLFTVTIPLALPGIVTGVALVLVASLTDVLAPTLLGGPYNTMISTVIFNIFTLGMNWNLGSAISVLVFAVLIVAAALTVAINRRVQYESET